MNKIIFLKPSNSTKKFLQNNFGVDSDFRLRICETENFSSIPKKMKFSDSIELFLIKMDIISENEIVLEFGSSLKIDYLKDYLIENQVIFSEERNYLTIKSDKKINIRTTQIFDKVFSFSEISVYNKENFLKKIINKKKG